jgi:hypothetical protein
LRSCKFRNCQCPEMPLLSIMRMNDCISVRPT